MELEAREILLLKTLGQAVESADRAAEATALYGLGEIRLVQKRYAEAVDFFNRSSATQAELGDETGQARSMSACGATYTFLRSFGNAEYCFQVALALQQKLGDPLSIGQTLRNFGLLRREQGQLAHAQAWLRQSITYLEKAGARAHLEVVQLMLEGIEKENGATPSLN